MLRLAPGSRTFMAVKPVDTRRSFDGLCATISEALGGDPLSGDVFLFRGKRADQIKAIASRAQRIAREQVLERSALCGRISGRTRARVPPEPYG